MTAIANQNYLNAALSFVGTAGYQVTRLAAPLVPTVVPAVAASLVLGYDVKRGVLQGLTALACGRWIVKPFLDYVQRNSGTGFGKINEKAQKFFGEAAVAVDACLPVAITQHAGDALLQLLTLEQRGFFGGSYNAEYTALKGLVTAGGILLSKHFYNNLDAYKKIANDHVKSVSQIQETLKPKDSKRG